MLGNFRLYAQQHFSYTANTGNNCTVALPLSANPSVKGVALAAGDEIGAFSSLGLCAGAVVWQNANTAITVWADDQFTSAIDGMQAGDTIRYRIWKKSENKEYSAVSVSYSSGNGVFQIDGINVISKMNVTISAIKGINTNQSEETNVSLYPNPVKNRVTAKISVAETGPVEIRLYNIIGQELERKTFQKENNQSADYSLQVSERWGAGIFLCRIIIGERSYYKKMLIVR
jgi:hypothetical protein